MMVAVFLMQPLGQLISQLVALGVLLGYNNGYNLQSCYSPSDDDGNCGRVVDSIWRWVAGVGAIPALVAIIFRFQIDDPGLYDLDVRDEGTRAVQNTMMLYRYRRVSTQAPNHESYAGPEMHQVGPDGQEYPPVANGVALQPHHQDEELPRQFSREDMVDYFVVQGNWRSLAGTSMCWFLLDM
jgi:PHS family inorganic phosphate transporter-like MFS transporter